MGNIALSYSRLSTYKTCPRKFHLQFIEKAFPDDSDNPYFVYGNNIHKQMEDYALWKERSKSIPTASPPKLNKVTKRAAPIVDSVYDTYDEVFPEQQICVNRNWESISWFDTKEAFYRVIYDLAAYKKDEGKGLLIDWKTGKVRDYDDSPLGQLRLSACVFFCLIPEVDQITTSYVFLDHKHTLPVTFKRTELESMKADFIEAHQEVNEDDSFEPKQNRYCKWCPATKDQCPYAKNVMR